MSGQQQEQGFKQERQRIWLREQVVSLFLLPSLLFVKESDAWGKSGKESESVLKKFLFCPEEEQQQ